MNLMFGKAADCARNNIEIFLFKLLGKKIAPWFVSFHAVDIHIYRVASLTTYFPMLANNNTNFIGAHNAFKGI